VYLPSGTSGPERQDIKYLVLDKFFTTLEQAKHSGKKFIICGDLNIAHKNIDIKNWRGNQKNSGFLPEERAWLDRVFNELGFIDAYRYNNPDIEQYTWWSSRGNAYNNNVGWRIDYQITTPNLAPEIINSYVYTGQRFSDHAPLIVDYNLELKT
jgi:exodeoxyribonuclease-3